MYYLATININNIRTDLYYTGDGCIHVDNGIQCITVLDDKRALQEIANLNNEFYTGG